MNDFEYLGRVTIGQYLPLASPFHRLDPRARLVAIVLVLAAVVITPSLIGVAVGLAVVLAGLALARIPLRFALRGLLTPLPFLLFIAAWTLVLNTRPESPPVLFAAGPVVVSLGDVLAAGVILLRFAALILGISLGTFTISDSELIHGSDALLTPFYRLGLPTRDVTMTLQVTLRFIPLLAQTAERIAKAQASRGAEWGAGAGSPLKRARRVLPLIVPLFVTTLRRAERLALAMEARGYNGGRRTTYAELHFGWRDALAVAVGAAAAAAIFLIR